MNSIFQSTLANLKTQISHEQPAVLKISHIDKNYEFIKY